MVPKIAFTSLVLGLLSFLYYRYNGVYMDKPLAAILLGGIALGWMYKTGQREGMKTAIAGVALGIAYLVIVYIKVHNHS